MYFAVVKLTFESEGGGAKSLDRHALHALAEKVRVRFKVCAACLENGSETTGLAITALGSTSARLTQTLDAIADFCETSGAGRIGSEESLLDHIDAVGELGA